LFEGCSASPESYPLYVYRSGALLCEAGAPATAAFVIVTGAVQVGHAPDRATQVLESFGDGDAVGLEAFFATVYDRTVRAAQVTVAYRLSSKELSELVALEPQLAINVARIEYARLERLRTILPPLGRRF
jgi:CRP-like cAMP-binding protein